MKVYLTKPPRTQTSNKWTSVLGFGLESQLFKSYGSFSDIALGWKEKYKIDFMENHGMNLH